MAVFRNLAILVIAVRNLKPTECLTDQKIYQMKQKQKKKKVK